MSAVLAYGVMVTHLLLVQTFEVRVLVGQPICKLQNIHTYFSRNYSRTVDDAQPNGLNSAHDVHVSEENLVIASNSG